MNTDKPVIQIVNMRERGFSILVYSDMETAKRDYDIVRKDGDVIARFLYVDGKVQAFSFFRA